MASARPQPQPCTLGGRAKPANEVTTDSTAISGRPGGAVAGSPGLSSACDPYREMIELGLSRGRSAMAICRSLHRFRVPFDILS